MEPATYNTTFAGDSLYDITSPISGTTDLSVEVPLLSTSETEFSCCPSIEKLAIPGGVLVVLRLDISMKDKSNGV